MAIPLGAIAYSAAGTVDDEPHSGPSFPFRRRRKRRNKEDAPADGTRSPPPSRQDSSESAKPEASVPPINIPCPSPTAATFLSRGSDVSPSSDFLATPVDHPAESGGLDQRPTPRNVDAPITKQAQPVVKPASLKPKSSSPNIVMSPPMYEPARPAGITASMSNASLNRSNANASNGARVQPFGGVSSYSSLAGSRSGYESGTETEASQEEGERHAVQHPAAGAAQRPSGPNSANLSGLICNVHRTTGKEPPPLVGATTTILGDKLYVFGGRRLTRTRTQLTSNVYELDLIHRHWTKLECHGDVPLPRYFHSTCALGDTKLVCYGGMSPAPSSETDVQSDVVVMSDIHIFDAPTRTWTYIPTPESPQGRYAHCATIVPSSAVFASATAPLSALQHNPQGAQPNQGSLGVAIDGAGGAEMVVIGGQDSGNHYIEQVSVFNLRSLRWTETSPLGRSCGAYRSVVTPLTTMSAHQIGAGPHAQVDEEDEEDEANVVGSGAPVLIYSNYNFLDVKLELQVRHTDGTLTEKSMTGGLSPPGLRFPNGGVIDNHFVVSGTFLASSKQEYALWALDLKSLSWSRIDAGGSIFSHGSWNRGVLWSRRNAYVILGNRKRSLVDDYNNRRLNFSNLCLVELEAFGLYENPRKSHAGDLTPLGPEMSMAAQELGAIALASRELADMDFLAVDGTRIPVNSRLLARRWGPHFTTLLQESMAHESDSATLRRGGARQSALTITAAEVKAEVPDLKSVPPMSRPRLLFLPHTAPTLHALLHFLYTSTLPSPPSPLATPQILCSLLQLARPYRIEGLLETVIQRLHESLDGRNAAAIFNAAAMGAGGGDGVKFAAERRATGRDSTIPPRTASLMGIEGLVNGMRLDTSGSLGNDARPYTEESEPSSATTDGSLSGSEGSMRSGADMAVWKGAMSSVVGLQKRGLRGLMEGRRMREQGRSNGERLGLGIS
ncbi:galactose oxidase [Piedraia hortae CBS 480.64]|uniref:Galactose oxidase n=1 Tax=Piedraia hortae CBS 480.64 TaxID=1314780 RepID=A0A6A7C818_9PEZI|nr:galactose oxidase [Piedraia hortae CBS 480.64]